MRRLYGLGMGGRQGNYAGSWIKILVILWLGRKVLKFMSVLGCTLGGGRSWVGLSFGFGWVLGLPHDLFKTAR